MKSEIFDPVVSDHGKRLMKKARTTNEGRDRADRQNGLAPGDGPADVWLRTAISAIAAGIDGKDFSCIAEGLDMLQNAEVRVRTLSSRGLTNHED